MLTRSATGSGTHQCGTGPLCGGTSAPCYNSLLVRFDNAGNEVWATPVTNLTASQSGYANGARFVWGHYQHHGRIAFDGENYAAYFCIGITVQNGSCIDIHEGDRMQVVDGDGDPVDNHPDSFPVGCSHSWTTRMVWDPRTNHFRHRVRDRQQLPHRAAEPLPDRRERHERRHAVQRRPRALRAPPGTGPRGARAGRSGSEHLTNGVSDQTISNAGASQHPHLVSYGANHMLLTRESGVAMSAQVRSSAPGRRWAHRSSSSKTSNYLAFKAFPRRERRLPRRWK